MLKKVLFLEATAADGETKPAEEAKDQGAKGKEQKLKPKKDEKLSKSTAEKKPK